MIGASLIDRTQYESPESIQSSVSWKSPPKVWNVRASNIFPMFPRSHIVLSTAGHVQCITASGQGGDHKREWNVTTQSSDDVAKSPRTSLKDMRSTVPITIVSRGGMLFCSHGNYLRRLDPLTGEKLWSTEIPDALRVAAEEAYKEQMESIEGKPKASELQHALAHVDRQLYPSGHMEPVRALAVSPDCSVLVTQEVVAGDAPSHCAVRLSAFSTADGSPVWSSPPLAQQVHRLDTIAFADNGNLVVVTLEDGSVHAMSAVDQEEAVALADDGSLTAAPPTEEPPLFAVGRAGRVLWSTGAPQAPVHGPTHLVSDQWFVYVGYQRCIVGLALHSGTPQFRMDVQFDKEPRWKSPYTGMAMRLDPRHGRLYAACCGSVACFSLSKGKQPTQTWLHHVEREKKHAFPAASLAVSSDGERLFVGDGGGSVHSLDPASGRRLWKSPRLHLTNTSSAFLVMQSDQVVVVGMRGAISGVDAATGKRMWIDRLSWINFGDVYIACADDSTDFNNSSVLEAFHMEQKVKSWNSDIQFTASVINWGISSLLDIPEQPQKYVKREQL